MCVTPIAQDDLGDGSGSPPLPPGAPPSWAGIGLGSLAPILNHAAFPAGGFAGITAGGGRLRFISAAPVGSQLVTPGASGGGGLGGGGQGHFVAAKVSYESYVAVVVYGSSSPRSTAHPTFLLLKCGTRARAHVGSAVAFIPVVLALLNLSASVLAARSTGGLRATA